MPAHDPDRTIDSPAAPADPTPSFAAATDVPGTDPAPPTDPTVPAGYELLGEVGRGGMGVVYRARDLSLERDVAVKVLALKFAPGSAVAKRFLTEARITGQLQHPGIPAVHQVGTLPDGRPFLAMKLIRGRTLDAMLKDQAGTDRGRLVAVFEQICQALAYAHAHRVIHRDLKPSNVMVGAFGEVQVMDWGLAKVLACGAAPAPRETDTEEMPPVTAIDSAREDDSATQAGALLGTPSFMSPEQVIGAIDQVNARSDVFGLGAILCTILTGSPPYVGSDVEATRQLAARAKLGDAFARLDGCGAEPDLVALAKRCLSADACDRPADAGEVARAVADLRSAAEQRARRAEMDREKAEVRAAEQRKRRRALLAAGGTLLAVLLVGVAGTTAGMVLANRAKRSAVEAEGREAEQRKQAEAQRDRAVKARDRTREVLDAMTSAVTGNALVRQVALSEEQKQFLTGVLAYYQEFAGESADDELSRFRTARAAQRLGFIEYRLGRTEAGAAAFARARDGYAALAADFPAEAAYRGELANCLNSVGALLAAVGRLKEAESAYHSALALQEKLAADDPSSALWRYELAGTHNNLGSLMTIRGNLSGAESAYRSALALQEKLAEVAPSADHRRELAATHDNLGLLLADLGKHAEAEAEYRKALTAQEQLAAESPAPEYRRELGHSRACLGDLLAVCGRRPEADVEWRAALAIQERLAAEFPSVNRYRADLARTHNALGMSLAGVGKSAEAEAEHRKALALLEGLAGDPEFRHELGQTRLGLGVLFFNGVGRRAEAEAEYRKARAVFEGLAAEFPAVRNHRRYLALCRNNLGLLLTELRRFPEAEAEYRAALAVQEPLAAESPGEPDRRRELAATRNHLGLLLAGRGRLPEAETEYRQVLAIREKLSDEFPGQPQFRIDFGGICCNYGMLVRDAGRPADSLEWFTRAVAVLTPLASDPGQATARRFLINSYLNRALTLDKLGRPSESAKDWARAEEMYPPQERTRLRLMRGVSRATAADAVTELGEAAELLKSPDWSATQFYHFAGVYASAAGKDAAKRDGYAARAVELLRRAVAKGYDDADQMAKDKDLDPIRGRDDFKKLLDELKAKAPKSEK
jgi:tetratricopeptide (TPR) repeat protein